MKIRKYLLLLLTILMTFSGCGNPPANKPDNGGEEYKYSTSLSNSASHPKGEYIIESNEKLNESYSIVISIDPSESSDRFSLIKFIDKETSKETVLCNKPNCAHNDSSCNAYVQSAFSFKPSSTQMGGEVNFSLMMSPYIFYYNNKLYVIDPFGEVTVMNQDGTSHEKLLAIDSKYMIDSGFLYNGKVYLSVRYLPEFDKSDELEFSDKDHNIALLEIDLQKKSCKELFSSKIELETTFLGLYDDKAYYFYRTPNTLTSAKSQKEVDDEENGHDVKLYCHSLSGGKEMISENIKSFEMDNVTLYKNGIYYHDRKEQAIKKYNLDTKENETVVENLGGYIDSFYTVANVDDKLFFVKNNSLSDAFADHPKANETFSVDLKTGEMKKVEK